MVLTLAALKARFRAGDRPSQQDLDDLIDTLTGGSTFAPNSIPLSKLQNGTPTHVLLANESGVAVWSALPSATPTGAAGGDLAGTYPNPVIKPGTNNFILKTVSNVATWVKSHFADLDNSVAIENALKIPRVNTDGTGLEFVSASASVVAKFEETLVSTSVIPATNTSAEVYTSPHGLGGNPDGFRWYWKCIKESATSGTNAEPHGYDVGDLLALDNIIYSTDATNHPFATPFLPAAQTSLGLSLSNDANPMLLRKTGVREFMTRANLRANFDLVIKAHRFQ